jgi:hypothetical protein
MARNCFGNVKLSPKVTAKPLWAIDANVYLVIIYDNISVKISV